MKAREFIASVRAPWLVTYLCLPLGFVLLEYLVRLVVGGGRVDHWGLIPYVSLSVALALLSIFVKDEISELSFLHPEDKDIQDKAAHKSIMDGYTIFFVALMTANTMLESVELYRDNQSLSDVLEWLRYGTLFLSISFIYQVLASQSRFNLRAG